MIRQLLHRRKRDQCYGDDASFVHSINSAATVSSLVAQAPDSVNRRARKRRRKDLLESLQNVNLSTDEQSQSSSIQMDVPDHILDTRSARPPQDDNSQLSDTSEDEESLQEDYESVELLSDAEKAQQAAERACMLGLVFGKDRSQNPVDVKLQSLVRESLQKSQQQIPQPQEAPFQQTITKDDMTVDTSYSRPTTELEFHRPTLQRSNSLPTDAIAYTTMQPMETEDTNNMDL